MGGQLPPEQCILLLDYPAPRIILTWGPARLGKSVAPGEFVAVVSIIKKSFRAGDQAPDSGIYRAIHGGHRKSHTVIVIRGDPFPSCRFCKDEAVFILVDAIPYIAHDLDFAGPLAEQAQA